MKLAIIISLITVSKCQIDGEFWWMNDKIKNLQSVKAEEPKFEEISVFDTDENDVIVFRDDSIFKQTIHEADNSNNKEIKNNTTIKSNNTVKEINLRPNITKTTEFVTYNLTNDKPIKSEAIRNDKKLEVNIPEINEKSTKFKDRLTFGLVENSRKSRIIFPKERFGFLDSYGKDNTNKWSKVESEKDNTKKWSKVESEKDNTNKWSKVESEKDNTNKWSKVESEKDNTNKWSKVDSDLSKISIKRPKFEKLVECVCMLEKDCPKASDIGNSKNCGEHCCIVTKEKSTKIIFPDEVPIKQKRITRSADKMAPSFIKSKTPSVIQFRRLRRNVKPPSSGGELRKIVTEDDFDPYWNIKNVFSVSNFSRNKKISTYGDYEYDAPELPRPAYQDEYADETPRPFQSNMGEDDDTKMYNYGGSPVLDSHYDHVTISTGIKVHPKPKPMPQESEEIVDEETEFSYNGNANFQVFQQFKLPGLFRKKNKTRRTTERPNDYDSLESVAIFPKPMDSTREQPWPKCGEIRTEGQYGNARKAVPYGSAPWLCLVTRTTGEGATLCAATLVHPRAALTSASCVHGAARGEVTVRTGDWESSGAVESRARAPPQRRRASVRAHHAHRPGDVEADLALLYWEQPLELCAGVQPACLAEPRDGDTCSFVGWGGAADVLKRRPMEQRAVILNRATCASHVRGLVGTKSPRGMFCARVLAPGCIAVAGGSLVCTSGGRSNAVGVAAWRASCETAAPVLLTSAREWTLRTLRDLLIN